MMLIGVFSFGLWTAVLGVLLWGGISSPHRLRNRPSYHWDGKRTPRRRRADRHNALTVQAQVRYAGPRGGLTSALRRLFSSSPLNR